MSVQLEEEIQEDLKWSMVVREVLHSGKSQFQSVELISSGPFGKVRQLMDRALVLTVKTSHNHSVCWLPCAAYAVPRKTALVRCSNER